MEDKHKKVEDNIRTEITTGTWNFIAQYRVIKDYLMIIFLFIFLPMVATEVDLSGFSMPLILAAWVVYIYERCARHHMTFNFIEKESLWESSPRISLNRKTLVAIGIGIVLGLILSFSVQTGLIIRPTNSQIGSYLLSGLGLIFISLLTIERLTWQPTKNVGYGMIALGVCYFIASCYLLIQ